MPSAVGFLNTGQLAGEGLQRFVPGDTFKFAFAAFANSFLGIHQSLRMMDVLPESPASQTGPELSRFLNIVALDPQNPIVLHMQLERAAPTTVKGGSGADDFYITIGLIDTFIAHCSPLTKNSVEIYCQFSRFQP